MVENNIEKYTLTGSDTCKRILGKHPDYRVFWRSGFAYRGAGESEDDKSIRKDFAPGGMKMMTFEERMQRRYDWAAAIDIEVNHEKKEIHFNGFSSNDLY